MKRPNPLLFVVGILIFTVVVLSFSGAPANAPVPSHSDTGGKNGMGGLADLQAKLMKAEKEVERQRKVNVKLAESIVRMREQGVADGRPVKDIPTDNRPPPPPQTPSPTPDTDDDESASAVSEVPITGVDETHVTVVLMSWPGSSRFHLLRKIVAYVRSWSIVYEVILVWNSDTTPPPSDVVAMSKATGAGAPFRIIPQKHNKIDNRWRIGDHIHTNAVLNMDDDVNLTKSGGDCLFNVWRQSPDAIVGVDVRAHEPRPATSPYNVGPWGYTARDKSRGYKQYSIMLPRALMTHRRHYLQYDLEQRHSDFRKIVDELKCDDIAFNFVVANSTGMAPIYAKAQYAPFPESHHGGALFREPGMKVKRQRCVNDLQKVFGPIQSMALKHRYWHVQCSVDG